MKPNHICKNRNCTKGADGGRKHYFACDLCDKRENWRSMACSYECYQEYMKQIAESRRKPNLEELYPDRTDMTKEQVMDMIDNKSESEIEESTKEDLKDYQEELETIGLAKTIDKINEELDQQTKKRTRKTK